MQLAGLPEDSEDIYVTSKFETYLQRNNALHNITYPMYFQWWRKCSYSEQTKGEKATEKGLNPCINCKGVDEFEELKASVDYRATVLLELSGKLEKLADALKDRKFLCRAVMMVLSKAYSNATIVTAFKDILVDLGYNDSVAINEVSDDDITEATSLLTDIDLLNSKVLKQPTKLHWLHSKLLQKFNNSEIRTSPLYSMLSNYPAGSMLADTNGDCWIRRASAAVTRHRFITIEDQELYYEQKYLLTVPLSPNDDIITDPPSSWVKVAIQANLVDEHHDAKATLMDAVKRGFSFENIQSIVQIYIEHQFLDEDEADAFLSTLQQAHPVRRKCRRSQINC